ncbi:hypothetical protein PINS_up020186 [Pythium insidiosum]|nr:hypothetical protein PINS_up020186 [Pythium insidiosum]
MGVTSTLMSTPSPPVPMDDASVEEAAASAVNSESEVTAAASAASTGKKRGRKPAKFWVSLTTIDEPYKQRAAPCRHCGATVKYHKKWEQAKGHLLKCHAVSSRDARARAERSPRLVPSRGRQAGVARLHRDSRSTRRKSCLCLQQRYPQQLHWQSQTRTQLQLATARGVTSCVLDLEHALGESVLKQLTTTELDSLRFTQLAPHRVLEALVADVLQSPEARDLVVTALKCHDVLSLAAKSPSMLREIQPRGTRCVVNGLRAINVWDALDSVVGLAKIVSEEGDDGQDGLLRDIRQRFPSEDVLSNVNELLADPSFRENLDLSLAVLAPFREFVDRVLQHDAAEIVPAFGTLHHEDEGAGINEKRSHLDDRVAFGGHIQAAVARTGVQDPVHAAAMLDQADNLVAEHLLLSSHTLSGGSKEELYMQLTAFQIAVDALQTAATDKPSSGDTVAETRAFSFKMLENRKKSAAQYWLTDGRQWPQLQRLALAVYQVPCIASVPHDVLERHCPHYNGGDAMKKWRASLNVAFLGVNAAVLGVDTVLETIRNKGPCDGGDDSLNQSSANQGLA